MATQVISGPEAAALLGVQEQTLRAWRVKGKGPRFFRFGGPRGRVRYSLQEVEAWLQRQSFQSTSEELVGTNGQRATA